MDEAERFGRVIGGAMREFHALVASGHGQDPAGFATMLGHAVGHYAVPVRSIVEGVGVAKGTVSKWQRGLQLPRADVRAAVAAVVLRDVGARISGAPGAGTARTPRRRGRRGPP